MCFSGKLNLVQMAKPAPAEPSCHPASSSQQMTDSQDFHLVGFPAFPNLEAYQKKTEEKKKSDLFSKM